MSSLFGRLISILLTFPLWAALAGCQAQESSKATTSGPSQVSPRDKDTSHTYSNAEDLSAAMAKAIEAAKTFHLEAEALLQFGPGSAAEVTAEGDYKIGDRGLDFRAIMTGSSGDEASGKTEMVAVDGIVYFHDITTPGGQWSDGIDIEQSTEWGTVQNPLTFVKIISSADSMVAEVKDGNIRYTLHFEPQEFFKVLSSGGTLPDESQCTATGRYSLTNDNLPTRVETDLSCKGQYGNRINMLFSRWKSPVSVIPPR